MEAHYKIIRELASGDALIASPEVLEVVEAYGLEVTSSEGELKLSQSMELLDPASLGELIDDQAKAELSKLDLHWSLDSTNTFLLSLCREPEFHGYACMAERQTAGKGRRGRHWVSPFGKNIYLSLGWRLPAGRSLDGLSLAVGCASADAIRALSPDIDLHLKWPNDLLLNGAKAGGILVELGQSGLGDHHVVVGVGINLQLSESDSSNIDQPWRVVRSVSRNRLAAALISKLTLALKQFAEEGFVPFVDHWNSLDGYSNQQVRIISPAGDKQGIANGVDEAGNLLLEVDGERQRINAGEVSLRPIGEADE